MKVHHVLESCLCAPDLEAAERFYTEVFGLELVAREPGRHVFFRCGESMVLVFNPEHTAVTPSQVNGAPIPLHGTTGAGHLAFRMEAGEVAAWRARLSALGVKIESEVEWPGGGHSLYVRDPAGNSIELATPALWGMA